MENDPYLDDNDFKCSSLNLSDPKTTQIRPNRKAEKRLRTSDEFQTPSTPARRQKPDKRTRKNSVSSQSSTDRHHQKQKDKYNYKPSTEKQSTAQTTNSNDNDLNELEQN